MYIYWYFPVVSRRRRRPLSVRPSVRPVVRPVVVVRPLSVRPRPSVVVVRPLSVRPVVRINIYIYCAHGGFPLLIGATGYIV